MSFPLTSPIYTTRWDLTAAPPAPAVTAEG